ncbi:ImmA/IrrE family metallo-endopeptidase [Aneurinibacillus migulanus]|uniref:ImmA/IrrE family metallo-endopeptidase n=1 Tax=Aneurinibacillus migulanus TaxID=47500 RepID=UPI0020A22A87|nr:ImmA/IrrE family metallo-endopeptidase [Aneurinibacillus migulanus]MCP1355075.1 ImmA/IrrE family metallo-endopeptidase [Aneurinibacillus migulanus]
MIDKVKVAGVDYTIEQADELNNDPGDMGECIYQKALIRIKSNMSIDKQNQTLVHEILHACIEEAGFSEQDEDFVNRVGIVLHQVLRDNDFSFLRE